MAKRSKSSKAKSNVNAGHVSGRAGLSSTYEDLHYRVSDHLALVGINKLTFLPPPEDDKDSSIKDSWSTNIMGRFDCVNGSCTNRGWGSKVVPIMIYWLEGKGCTYSAHVFHQRCKKCNEVGTCHIDKDTYVERVVYWLKVWSNKPVVKPDKSIKKGLPQHKSELCMGCAQGRCRAGRITGKRGVYVDFEDY